MEKLLIAFIALTFLIVVLPFLILGGAFWIVRRCAGRWQTVFWQAGVYGTGAGLGALALYTVTHALTADLSGLLVASPADGFPLATTVLLAVWALAILYLARGREAAEAAGRRNLRRSVVGAYVTLALVAAWTAAWLHPDRSQGAVARIWKLDRDCEVYSLQYPNLQSRKCSPVDRRSGRFVLPNTASIQPRNSRNSSRSRAGSPGRRRA